MQKDRIVSSISSVALNPEEKNVPVKIDNIEKTMIYGEDAQGNAIATTIQNGYLDIGIIDTMKDLLVNFIGAFVFSILGLFYIKNRNKYKFAENFIPKLRRKKV